MCPMADRMRITQFTVTVHDYDEAIAFYTQVLGFQLLEDIDLRPGADGQTKRWVRVAPPGSQGPAILLARAATPDQLAPAGNQTGGRVFIFLETDDLERDFAKLTSRGVRSVRPPTKQPYGTVAVFQDLYGNRFDLIESSRPESSSQESSLPPPSL